MVAILIALSITPYVYIYILYYVILYNIISFYIMYMFRPLRGDRRPLNLLEGQPTCSNRWWATTGPNVDNNHVQQPMVGHQRTNFGQTLDKLWT